MKFNELMMEREEPPTWQQNEKAAGVYNENAISHSEGSFAGRLWFYYLANGSD